MELSAIDCDSMLFFSIVLNTNYAVSREPTGKRASDGVR